MVLIAVGVQLAVGNTSENGNLGGILRIHLINMHICMYIHFMRVQQCVCAYIHVHVVKVQGSEDP